jgi:Secretion system C-terminal sorting domain/Cleaved Adhesin Domain
MKKLLLLIFAFLALNASSQTILFEDSFDFYDDFLIDNVGDWTLTDVDLQPTGSIANTVFANSAAARSFMVFNPTTTAPPITTVNTAQNWTARTGDKHMVCFYTAAAVPVNNDWMISPQITLGTSNVLKFWAKACNATFGAERFSVWVSTTDTNVASFTKISAGTFITTSGVSWVERTYNLATSYDNLPVYIAIRCQSADQFGFAVDDFSVTGTVLGTDTFFASNFAVSPNPANDVINITNKNNAAISSIEMTDINGRTVKQINGAASQINISDLTAGVYFLKVASENGVGSTKIIKN